MLTRKATGTNNLLVLGGQEKLLKEWVSSENAPKLEATDSQTLHS